MMRYIFVFTTIMILLLISCNKPDIKPDLELIVENDTILNGGIGDTCINILKFSIRNNSDKIYYMNNCSAYKLRPSRKIGILSDFIHIYIYDQKGKEIKCNLSYFKPLSEECYVDSLVKRMEIREKSLRYENRLDYNWQVGRNFFIHPGESVYLEQAVDLSGPVGFEDARIGYADLDKSKKYYATVSFASDSSKYRSSLPRDILMTIKENHAEVYSGTLESAKIPIKFVN